MGIQVASLLARLPLLCPVSIAYFLSFVDTNQGSISTAKSGSLQKRKNCQERLGFPEPKSPRLFPSHRKCVSAVD